MLNIRCVCLSDMHLGEEDSVLTNLVTNSPKVDPKTPSPVLQQLVLCIKNILANYSIGEKPLLVLNGDILDLALSKTGDAIMVFQRFIELIMEPGEELFSRIVYIPGNHDHHLWEIARETQYVEYITHLPEWEDLPDQWHTTNMFSNTVRSYLLNKVIHRLDNLKEFNIEIAYPNFALSDKNTARTVVFSHGHYTESIYRIMSKLHREIFDSRAVTNKIWDIENENFAWIDFVWSTLGRSGIVGDDVESVYEKLSDKNAFKSFLREVAANLAKIHKVSNLKIFQLLRKTYGEHLDEDIFYGILNKIFGNFSFEKYNSEGAESKALKSGLHQYLDETLRRQFSDEGRDREAENVSFIFGHTHKPYITTYKSPNYSNGVKIINSGGWVVETPEPDATHGGSVIFLDSELNAVSLCMYRESIGEYRLSLEEPRGDGEGFSPLYRELNNHIVQGQEPWSSFSKLIASAVSARHRYLKERIHSKRKPSHRAPRTAAPVV